MVGLQKGPDLKMDVRGITEDTTPCPTSEGLTGNHEALRMVHPRNYKHVQSSTSCVPE